MLSKPHRLKARTAKFVARRGRSLSSHSLRIKWTPARGQVSRTTVVVGLAVDKRAVQRNLIKRRLREGLRPVVSQLRPKVNLMVFVNKKATEASFQELEKELISLIKRAKLL